MLKLKSILNWVLYEWNEFFTIPIGIFLFIVTPEALRGIDPTAAPFDVGVLHALMYGLAGGFIILGATWFTLKITFPKLYNYLDEIETRINELTEWERAKLSLGFFALVLFTFLFLASSVL